MARFRPLIFFKIIPTMNWTLSISKGNGEDSDPVRERCAKDCNFGKFVELEL